MKIFRKLIDVLSSKPLVQKKEMPDTQTFDLNRRDFGKTTAVGAIAAPAITLDASVTKITQAVSIFLSRASGTTEQTILSQILEWGFSRYFPEFIIHLPGKDNLKEYPRAANTIGNYGLDFPMDILKKAKESIPVLLKAAENIDILPSSHMPDERISDPLAWGYPKCEHVCECPYCLGAWAKGWIEMLPQYQELLKVCSIAADSIRKDLPKLSKDQLIGNLKAYLELLRNQGNHACYFPGGKFNHISIDDHLKN